MLDQKKSGEQAAIDEFHVKHCGLVVGGRLDRQLQVDFEQAVGATRGVPFHTHVDGGLAVDAQAVRRLGVFERQVADILGQDAEAGALRLAALRLGLVGRLAVGVGGRRGVGHESENRLARMECPAPPGGGSEGAAVAWRDPVSQRRDPRSPLASPLASPCARPDRPLITLYEPPFRLWGETRGASLPGR